MTVLPVPAHDDRRAAAADADGVYTQYLRRFVDLLDEAHLGSIEAGFVLATDPLSTRSFAWLTARGVSLSALMHDGDGSGWPLASARVERVGRRFAFREDGAGAFVAVARDEDGTTADLVAWAPKDEWVAPLLGDVAVLGQHDLLAPRGPDPLRMHRDVLGWLRAERHGAVILCPARARRMLVGTTLQAEDVDHGVRLRQVLMPPEPRIVVPADVVERVAA